MRSARGAGQSSDQIPVQVKQRATCPKLLIFGHEDLDDQFNAATQTIRELESATSVFFSHFPTKLTLSDETLWAFVSAVMLVLGTTVYKLFCPPSVKRFSEIEWVAQLRRPRLLHIADSLACGPPSKRWTHSALQLFTGVFVLIGGGIAIVLLAIRIWKLFGLIVTYMR